MEHDSTTLVDVSILYHCPKLATTAATFSGSRVLGTIGIYMYRCVQHLINDSFLREEMINVGIRTQVPSFHGSTFTT